MRNAGSSLDIKELLLLPIAELREKMGVGEQGLADEEAAERLEEVGPNRIVSARHENWARDILRRCQNPLVIQLLVILVVSYALGDPYSGTVVLFMILISVGLSYVQEARSTNAMRSLQRMVRTLAVVIRNGQEKEIAIEEVVPGDVVVLAAGSIIPADLRILMAKDFFVSQSALTGESMPIEKSAELSAGSLQSPLEANNACFMGSNVVSGSATGLVLLSGRATYFGKISERLAKRKETTSFEKGIHGFTMLMVRCMVVMVAIVFLIVGATKHNWSEALLFGLSIAVGLTPEMLPMILTVCLSKGALLMSKKKVIVRRLDAIQNFGAMDVLCTDKTGTLTQDRVVLERHVDVTGRESEDVLRYAWMNSYYQTGLRNLLDRAVLAHTELDVDRDCIKVDEIPFDFQRRRMSVIIGYEGAHVLICKGAVEEVSAICSHYQVDEEIYPLIPFVREDLLEEYRDLSAEGYRVVAVAYREFDQTRQSFSKADERGLILLGYIAFFDPPKDTAEAAIQALVDHGVAVKILTGDNELVSRKVCTAVGLKAGRVATGPELEKLPPNDFLRVVQEANVLARLAPAQKEGVIQALKKQGHVVGFMGDGINDVMAMKSADVAISVDTAVDVAKESADIILLEKSLMVLEEGIIEGRKVFGNIIKYIKMGSSSNFGNMFSMLGASYLLPFLPMLPVQVLINNLLYDISQVGIPSDRVDQEYITRPRKWNISNIRKFMMFLGPVSSLFDYCTFFVLLYLFGCASYKAFPSGEPADAHSAYLATLFHSTWFVESLLTQTLIVHVIRTRRIPFLQSRSSPFLALMTLLVMVIGVWLPYSPFASFLGLVPLPALLWVWIAGFMVAYVALAHFVKTWFYRRFGDE
ncbi:MAG: magnesium-translocating P-type ATPase [Verrucomicrobia bacterium]|nr:MAG: magnesium-translocating P-type ATPase [Verrucomicrobiota bacterium]